MRFIFLLSILGFPIAGFAQKWQPGYFYDIKGNKVPGLIQHNPGGKGPIKKEGFIIYKDNPKANEIKLSASDIKYYIVGKDSFIVAHPPAYELWPKADLDFIKVELDEPLKLYTYGGSSGGGGGFRVSPSFSGGFGTGGYGGGGIGINLGSGGGNGGGSTRVTYYFGTSVGDMSQVTPMNFIDVMTDIMADEPQAVEAIQQGKFNINKMQGLVNLYQKLKANHNKIQ